jgi:hypothetical protein
MLVCSVVALLLRRIPSRPTEVEVDPPEARQLEHPIPAWLQIAADQAARQIVAAVSKHRNMESQSE